MAEIEKMRERVGNINNSITSMETELSMRQVEHQNAINKLKEEFGIEDPGAIQTLIEEKSAEIAKLRETITSDLDEIENALNAKKEIEDG